MNVEQTLTDELQTVATGVSAPPPPAVDALVRRAGHERTRARVTRVGGVVLVAAAVVGAVVIGSQIGRPTSAPPHGPADNPTSLPTGGAPAVPYILGETLYVDGKPQPGTWIGVSTAGGNTLAIQSAGAGSSDVKGVLFRSGALVETLPAGAEAMLSPHGTKLAWFEVSGRTADLVVRDLTTDREMGRLPLDPDTITGDSEATVHMTAIDDDGTVHWGGVLVSRSWKPGSTPVDVAEPAQTPDVPGFPRVATGVVQSPDEAWGAWLTDRDGRSETSSDVTAFDGVTLQAPGERGSRFTIALPVGTDVRALAWESATDLLLTVFDDPDGAREHLVRCRVTDRQCEIAETS